MKITRKDILVDGHLLNCTVMDPISIDDSVSPAGVCLFTHGQGDYTERYTEVLHPFTERQIRCIAFDLPGHGDSPGRRGHVGNLSLIDAVIAKGLEMAGDLPYGIAGHSMGGLLTLRHLTLALQGHLPKPDYCWVNAALLSPAENMSDAFVKCAKLLSKIYPWLMVKTGTSPDLCRTESPDTPHVRKPGVKKSTHQRISVKWGVEVIKASEFVRDNLLKMESNIPLLYTQGGTDFICPDHLASSFFSKLNFTDKTYKLFPEMRHETFAEPQREDLFSKIGTWLDQRI